MPQTEKRRMSEKREERRFRVQNMKLKWKQNSLFYYLTQSKGKKKWKEEDSLAQLLGRKKRREVRPDLIREEWCYEYVQKNNSRSIKSHLHNMISMTEDKLYCWFLLGPVCYIWRWVFLPLKSKTLWPLHGAELQFCTTKLYHGHAEWMLNLKCAHPSSIRPWTAIWVLKQMRNHGTGCGSIIQYMKHIFFYPWCKGLKLRLTHSVIKSRQFLSDWMVSSEINIRTLEANVYVQCT